jgi:hypothetical protein
MVTGKISRTMEMVQLAIIATSFVFAIAPLAALTCIATGASACQRKGESLTDVNEKLTNPLNDLWSTAFQQNNCRLSTVSGQGDKWSSNLNFQLLCRYR